MKKEVFYQRVGYDAVREAVEGLSTPSYAYIPAIMRAQVDRIRACTGGRFDVHYAVKANPSPAVLEVLAAHGVGADVASIGELRTALSAGVPAHEIEFSGPGKRLEEIELAVREGISSINVESVDEVAVVGRTARALGLRANVGVRINPGDTGARGGMRMAGDTQFGIIVDDVPMALDAIAAADDLDFTGFHAHFASQELDATSLVGNMRILLGLARDLSQGTGLEVKKLNFGGGWGIDYFPNQEPLDLELLGSEVDALLAEPDFTDLLDGTRLIVEPGRFIAGESGVFATEVLYVKRGATKAYAVVDGGMNANYVLAGGMGTVIRRNFEVDVLPTASDRSGAVETFDIAGPLCTPQDILATNVSSEHGVAPGDHIVFFNCGAYGPSASPLGFLSHAPPDEALVDLPTDHN